MKTLPNNVYDVHAQQKLVTPHIRDRYLRKSFKKKESNR